jgi:thiamine pyrophosphokinase
VNDLEKCINYLSSDKTQSRDCIVVFGGGGRLDQEMCNLNVLYKTSLQETMPRMVLVSQFSACFLLVPNEEHIVIRNPNWERKTCAIVPLGEPCDRVKTKGLKWDMNLGPHDNIKLRFGDLISSSNEFSQDRVEIKCSHPVIWITNIEPQQ